MAGSASFSLPSHVRFSFALPVTRPPPSHSLPDHYFIIGVREKRRTGKRRRRRKRGRWPAFSMSLVPSVCLIFMPAGQFGAPSTADWSLWTRKACLFDHTHGSFRPPSSVSMATPAGVFYLSVSEPPHTQENCCYCSFSITATTNKGV